jgi:hypothetical protein
MPPIADPSLIRAILEQDPSWAAYALGDLSPGFAEHCQWFVLEQAQPALLLLYQRFDPPVLFAMGPPGHLEHRRESVRCGAWSWILGAFAQLARTWCPG